MYLQLTLIYHCSFSQQEVEAKLTSFRNLLLVRQATATAAAAVHAAQGGGVQAVTANTAAAALAAITAAATLASHGAAGGHRFSGSSGSGRFSGSSSGSGGAGGHHHHANHQLAAQLRTSAAAASLASSVANAAHAFTQKPSNAILNLRLNQQLHQQRLSNAILTGTVMQGGSTYR